MTVYVDVLIFLNTIVNYFILLLTAKLCFRRPALPRLVGAAFVGALFSLYIFLPDQPLPTEMIVRLACSAVIVVIGFGFQNLKSFARVLLLFYAASFLLAGLLLALWYIARPPGMLLRNGVAYFNLSPLLLICSTAVCYLLILLFRKFTGRDASAAGRCKIRILCDGKEAEATALLDSGNGVRDLFDDAGVVIVDPKVAETLFGSVSVSEPPADPALRARFRLVPYRTVGGEGLLPSFRSDCVEVRLKSRRARMEKAVVAVSSTALGEDYDAILNPEQL